MSQGFARRRRSSNARASTPWSAQGRRPSVTTSPKSHACLQREAEARLGAGLEGEGNEVADFVDELTERVARRLLRGGAQLLGPAERAVAAIQQGAHVYRGRLGWGGDRSLRGRCRASGVARLRWSALRARHELGDRCRTDPSLRQPLVGGPRPDEVGRFGNRQVGPLRGSGSSSTSGGGGGGSRLDGPERGSQGVELGRERFLVTGA